MQTADEMVTNLTHALKENGMFENSVIIIASDNGSPRTNMGTNWPLRGQKGTYFEGGVKVRGLVYSMLIPR